MTITLNGRPTRLDGSATVAELLARRQCSAEGIAVAVNGTVVPRAHHATASLAEGDQVEIVTAVQGG